MVGFGISDSKQASQILSYGADGVVVGSAIIKTLQQGGNNDLLGRLKKFVTSIKH